MNNRSAQSLVAAERMRQIAVDDAKRALSDAIYVCNAAQKKVEALQAQAASAEAHALALLQAPGILDVSSLHAAQRYRRWHRVQLDAARQSLAREERAEAEARSALGACVRARDAVRRLQARRLLEERERAAHQEQHALDDLGAIRAMASNRTSSFTSGDQNGR
jgi:flagellar export protein FliJ